MAGEKRKNIPWITPTDITKRLTCFSNLYLTKKGQEKARIVPSNSLLVTCIASIGKNTINVKKSAFYQQINVLIPYKNYNIDFLFFRSYFLLKLMQRIAPSGMMQIINKNEFSKIKIRISSLQEQSKIADLLSTVDDLIALNEQKLSQMETLK